MEPQRRKLQTQPGCLEINLRVQIQVEPLLLLEEVFLETQEIQALRLVLVEACLETKLELLQLGQPLEPLLEGFLEANQVLEDYLEVALQLQANQEVFLETQVPPLPQTLEGYLETSLQHLQEVDSSIPPNLKQLPSQIQLTNIKLK